MLSRQGLPILDPDAIPADAIERGAYVLREEGKATGPELILIGTGSEVSICLEAAEVLEGEGIATRVVSMPCFDRFVEQDEGYRDSVLPPAVPRAGVGGGGRHASAGSAGSATTASRSACTASAPRRPAKDLYAHFGFTPRTWPGRQRVVERLGAGRS